MNLDRYLTLLLTVMLVLTVIPMPISTAEVNPPTDRGDGVWENNEGEWIIEEQDTVIHEDRTIILNGNLTVLGSLTLVRCEVIMNTDGSIIRVDGELILENTSIAGGEDEGGEEMYFSFIVHGRFIHRNSHLLQIAGSDTFPFTGGLQLYSEDVHMDGGSIQHAEFTGLFIAANVTLWNLTVSNNMYNVVMYGSTPALMGCIVEIPGSVSLFMANGSHPIVVGGVQRGAIQFHDEASSLSYGHALHVRVTFENGTAIPGVSVTATDRDNYFTHAALTDGDGWVRNMILPRQTRYRSIADRVYNPYRLTVEKFGLQVMESIVLPDAPHETTREIILAGEYFGEVLARGDFNGDGLLDLAVGVPRNRTGVVTHGAILIFLNYGSLELSSLAPRDADLVITGAADIGFGSVLAAGDINGDGFDDLLVGVPSSDTNGPGSGEVLFFLGGPDPGWASMADADFSLHGDPGMHFGQRILVADLNGDACMDFVIGDADSSHVFYGDPDPVEAFSPGSVWAYPTVKGRLDTTLEPIEKLQANDNDRYTVYHPNDGQGRMTLHVKEFSFGHLEGTVTSATLWIQFTNDQYYGYNDWERSPLLYNTRLGDGWKPSLYPRVHSTDWRTEQTWSFDLLADGITSTDHLERIELYLTNTDGTNNSQANNNIYFDYLLIHVTTVPSPARILPSGNLSAGDVNGDGIPDLIISEPHRQMIYFGSLTGIGAPRIIPFPTVRGAETRVTNRNGELSITEVRPYLNGQFDDGWEGWMQVANTRGHLDSGTRWSIVTEEAGDWKVHEGPTGGFGSARDNIGGGDNSNRDCRGMLRTQDFIVTEDMETVRFWYNFRTNSFEPAGGNQGEFSDEVRYGIYSADDGSMLLQIAGWAPSQGNSGTQEDGIAEGNITGLRGMTVFFGMEIITNRGQQDRAMVQVDNLTILPPATTPYYLNGTFVSEWIPAEGILASLVPTWDEDLNDAMVTVKFRTDRNRTWEELPAAIPGETIMVDGAPEAFQFMVTMEGNGNTTPFLGGLTVGYMLAGQIMPLALGTGYGHVSAADMDGDGIDDLLFFRPGADGEIRIFHGLENLSRDYDPSGIGDLYSGAISAFSVTDLEADGSHELCLVGTSIRIIAIEDGNATTLWERSVTADRIVRDVAGDPFHQLSTGAVYFVPSHDRDVRVKDVAVPDLVDPGEEQVVTVSVGNLGTLDLVNLTLTLTVTSDQGYLFTDSREMDLDSMTSEEFLFAWNVPADEGVIYSISADLPLTDDRVPGDNTRMKDVTSKEHLIHLASAEPTRSGHGGDWLVFPVTIDNLGTFEEENVTLGVVSIPDNWTGHFFLDGGEVTHVTVTDTIHIEFRAASPADEEHDVFPITLSGQAVTSLSVLDLTASILRPDLIVEEIRLVRADGMTTNDTVQAVAGDPGTIEVRIGNPGPTYATGSELHIFVGGEPFREFTFDLLGSGESMWFSAPYIAGPGELSVRAHVDPDGMVPETDAGNNELERAFTVKDATPVGPYNLSGVILNIFGEPVSYADVTYEWGAERETDLTDENGLFSLALEPADYYDGQALYLNGTDGENVTSVRVLLYSQDGGIHLVLTLNQYIVAVRGPDTVSTVDPNGTILIELHITNHGNINTSFVLKASEIPEGWSVTFPDLPGDTGDEVFLNIEETVMVLMEITSSADPWFSRGHQKYFVTAFVYAGIFPAANASFSYGIVVNPVKRLVVLPDGEDNLSARPGDNVTFDLMVLNLGNEANTYIPTLTGPGIERYEFNVTYLFLGINEPGRFSLTLTMPLIPSGATVAFQVGGSDVHVTATELQVTALDHHALECVPPLQFTAFPDETLRIPLTVLNTGNLRQTITLSGSSGTSGVSVTGENITLDMDRDGPLWLEVTLPGDLYAGTVVPVEVNLSAEDRAFLEFSIHITILEVRGFTLQLLETVILPENDFTTYRFDIKATNTGNSDNTFRFRGMGSHPNTMSVPAPLTLGAGKNATIQAMIIVPLNRTGVIDNYIIPADNTSEYMELNLRIPGYIPRLSTKIIMGQNEYGYRYDIQITNTGQRFEHMTINLNLPEVPDGYEWGDRRWEGHVNRAFLELMPGAMQSITVMVTTPEKREYYGRDMSIDLNSATGTTTKLVLHKPPIAVIGANLKEKMTYEDVIRFTGGQSVWDIMSYTWDFGDGRIAHGTTVDHSFGRSGTHLVTLTVEDIEGFTATAGISLTIDNIAPHPVVLTNPADRKVEVGQPIIFDASLSQDRDGSIVHYLWEFGAFGDYFEGIWPVIEHSFRTVGTYTVTLYIRDNSGAISNISVEVTVLPKSTVDPGPDTPGETTTVTDPLSYLPLALLVVVVIVGMVVIIRKRKFVDHLVGKIAEEQGKGPGN